MICKPANERHLARSPLGTALTAALLLTVVGTTTAQASEEAAQAVVTVDAARTALHMDWTPVAHASDYVAIDDRTGEVLWTGTADEVTLPVSAPASMALVVVSRGAEGPELVFKTVATVPDIAGGLTPLTATTTAEDTALWWAARPDIATWSLTTAGGPPVGLTSTTARVPTALGETADLAVVGDIAGTNDSLTYGATVRPASTDVSQVDGDARPGTVVAASIARLTSSRTNYETYIPMQYLDAPDGGSWINCDAGDGSDYGFAGDNRGVGYGTGKYRTAGNATYSWTGASITTSTAVAPTKRYKINGSTWTYESTRTASSAGFHVRALQNDGRYGRTVIEHSVGNPYCSSLADIDYANQQDVYADGSHWIYGSHDKMPNHQFYRRDSFSDGTALLRLIFHHKLESPNCLFSPYPGCGSNIYQYVS